MSRGRIQIGSPALMRETNARTLLKLMRELGVCSRADLVRKTGMSAPTVANVISDLDKRGLIEWIGEGVSSGGRRPDNFRFHANHACILGVNIRVDSLHVLLTDLEGTSLGERHEPLPRASRNPSATLEVLSAAVRELLKKQKLSPNKLLAMTVGVAGITNVREGIVISVGDSAMWRNVPLLELLRQRFPCLLRVENDANLAAIGEHYKGVAGSEESFVFILITSGSGVGAGVFVNGEIVHGSNWSAGEIGYLHIPHVPSGKSSLYEYGRLEQLLSGPGVLKSFHALSGKNGKAGTLKRASSVLDLARIGDAAAQKVLQQRARLLADVVLNLALMLDPALFVFGGDLGAHPALLEPTVELLRRSNMAMQRVLPSSLGDSAVVWGAIAVALRESEARLYQLEA